jgi:hypothetical protein
MAGRSVALLLGSFLLAGCSVHWGNGELKPASKAAVRDGKSPIGSRTARLSEQLDDMGGRVEARLASLPTDAASAERAALREERLRIVVALAYLEAAAEAKRTLTADTDVDTLLMDAADRIDGARSRGRADDADLDSRDRNLRPKLFAVLGKAQTKAEADKADGGAGYGRASRGPLEATGGKNRRKKSGSKARGRKNKARGGDDPLAGLLGGPGGAEPAPDAKPAPAAAMVANSGPPPDVWPEVERKLEEVRACLAPEQRDVGVALDVRARIAADGSFRRVRVRAQPSLPPGVTSCVADVLTRIKVEPTGVSRVVKIPFSAGGG